MKRTTIAVVFIAAIAVLASAVWLQASQTEKASPDVARNNDPKGNEPPTLGREIREWMLLPWRDANGNIPAGRTAEALAAREEYLNSGLDADGFGELAVSHLRWRSRGPNNIGGRTRQVIVHPTRSDILWAAAIGGGVWKSTDRGENWTPTNGGLENYVVTSLALDPNSGPDYDTLYAGTGEGGYSGGGIFKSTDGGESWALLPDTVPSGNCPGSEWCTVFRIAVQPGASNIVLASNTTGIWRSENWGDDWAPVETAQGRESRLVAFDPNNGQYAVAEVKLLYGLDLKATAMYSTDGGQSFLPATRNDIGTFAVSTRIELVYGYRPPEGVPVVYALNQADVSRSVDGGHTFTRMSTGLPVASSEWATAVWASPTVANDLLIGGTSHIYRSTDGGASFVPISYSYIFDSEQPHVDHHCFVSDPQVPARVWACNDGGVYLAENIYQASATGGWDNKNRSYRTTEYVAGVGDGPTGVIYGGTQDNGSPRSYLSDPNSLAIPLLGGDGGPTQITTDAGHCFGQLPAFELRRNNCLTQNPSYNGEDIVRGANPIPDVGHVYATTHIYAPFVLDPNDTSGNTIIAGGASLWRTRNARGDHDWFCIRGANGGPCPSPGGTPIAGIPARAIAVAPGNADIIWVAYNDHNGGNTSISKTTNGTRDNPSWVPVAIPTTTPIDPTSSRVVNQILIDPDNANKVYLARGAGANNLLKTTNGGNTWVDITGPPPDLGGLPEVPINGIARHPNYPNKLYAGTGIGLYSSINGGSTWDSELVGPAKVNVTQLSFMRGTTTLLAVTYGRAAWTAETNPLLSPIYIHFDTDGDGRADPGVFRPSDGTWRVRQSQDNFMDEQFGAEGDVVAVQDYDGDKRADLTVFRAAEGAWYRLDSSDGSFHATYFGTLGDIVVPADYDGDGLGDEAVFRPSDQNWYIDLSTTGPTTVNWGLEDDKPVGADFDGDGLADIGVFRLKDGIWYLLTTGSGNEYYQFGMDGDLPVAADYDGDGMTDVAVWRPSSGDWYFLNSGGGVTGEHFGQMGDVPVPADYDGDGHAEVAVWRPSNGYWYFRNPDTGYSSFKFGADGDVPISSYVLNRDAARMAPTGINGNVPKIDGPTAEWFATGIPQERFARKTFKPGSFPGISDPDRIRKQLGQPPRR